MRKFSNCCNAPLIVESDLCSECLEHCEQTALCMWCREYSPVSKMTDNEFCPTCMHKDGLFVLRPMLGDTVSIERLDGKNVELKFCGFVTATETEGDVGPYVGISSPRSQLKKHFTKNDSEKFVLNFMMVSVEETLFLEWRTMLTEKHHTNK